MGYVVRDPAGKPVRQFVSYDGKNFNIIAFYVDGVEAYREVYPPQADRAVPVPLARAQRHQVGARQATATAAIDEWVVISPEELSQELLRPC